MSVQDRRELYRKATRFEKTPYVPTYSNYWTWIYLDSGIPLRECIYDLQKGEEAIFGFMKKYDFDSYGFFGPRSPYRVTDPLDGNHYILNDEAQTINIKDKKLMEADEYDELIENVWKFTWEKAIPRKCPGLLKDTAWEQAKVSIKEQGDFGAFVGRMIGHLLNDVEAPMIAGAWGLIPFEMLFNYYRGIKDVSIDLRRRYDKVVEASKACEGIADMPAMYAQLEGDQPPIFAHEGAFCLLAHSILNQKQWAELFWPYIAKAADICAKKDKTLFMFTESEVLRFDQWADLPEGTVMLEPEEDDVFELRKKFPKLAINGGMLSTLLGTGTKEQCLDYAKKLVDELGPGFIMGQNKMMSFKNDAKSENVMAVQEFCKNYKY